MPVRHRSHQAEDKSIRLFEAALPDHWVCRRKERDYGIDLEVEIFEADGAATGLMFYAQLKATDNPKQATHVAVKRDRLKYLNSFSTPGMIVRCCNSSGNLFWLWAAEALEQASGHANTPTVTLNRLLDEHAPDLIVSTLTRIRRLSKIQPNEPLVLDVSCSQPLGIRLNLEAALETIFDAVPLLRRDSTQSDALRVSVHLDDSHLSIAFGSAATLLVELSAEGRNDLHSTVAYTLLAACWKLGLTERAASIARHCLANELVSDITEFAIISFCALRSDPEDVAAIAILNGLHKAQTPAYLAVISTIVEAEFDTFSIRRALIDFYDAALEAGVGGASTAAAIYYSRGNALAAIGDRWEAFRCFNAARHLRPAYLRETYFLNETASALFFCRRYRLAKKLYGITLSQSADSMSAFRYADASFFAGDQSEACRHFQMVQEDCNDIPIEAEAFLKGCISSWLSSQQNVPVMIMRDANLIEAHKHYRQEGAIPEAFWCLMAATFLNPEAIDRWVGCLMLACVMGDFAVVSAVIHCSVYLMGVQPYQTFRMQTFPKVGDVPLADLDEVFLEARECSNKRQVAEPVLRFLKPA